MYLLYTSLYVLYANWCNCADECRALAWLTSPLRSMSLYPDGCLKLYPLLVETWCRVYPYPHVLYWQNHLWIFGRMQYIVWFCNIYRHYIDLFHYMYVSTYFWIYIYTFNFVHIDRYSHYSFLLTSLNFQPWSPKLFANHSFGVSFWKTRNVHVLCGDLPGAVKVLGR